MDKEYYDLCYEQWMRGRNPDEVSADDYDYCRSQGYYPDEISLRMVTPPDREPEEAPCQR